MPVVILSIISKFALVKTFVLFFFQQHSGVCQKLPVHCTNKCGLRDIPREKVTFIEFVLQAIAGLVDILLSLFSYLGYQFY